MKYSKVNKTLKILLTVAFLPMLIPVKGSYLFMGADDSNIVLFVGFTIVVGVAYCQVKKFLKIKFPERFDDDEDEEEEEKIYLEEEDEDDDEKLFKKIVFFAMKIILITWAITIILKISAVMLPIGDMDVPVKIIGEDWRYYKKDRYRIIMVSDYTEDKRYINNLAIYGMDLNEGDSCVIKIKRPVLGISVIKKIEILEK